MKVSVHVQALVAERGWDEQELARRTGIDAETARTLVEGGAIELDKAELGRLSEALGVLPNEILSTVEEKQPSAIDALPARDLDAPTATEAAQPTRGESDDGTSDTRDV